jgi:hypothetical protein
MTPEQISKAVDDLVDRMDDMTIDEFEEEFDKIYKQCQHKVSLGRCKYCGVLAVYCR